MKFKSLLILFSMVFAIDALAQNSVFSFNEIQCRNSRQQWEKVQKVDERIVRISGEKINVVLDKMYNLKIVSKTFLPNKGAIYLCNDDAERKVTVMIVNNDKMYVYNDTKRFLVNLSKLIAITSNSKAYADID